MASVSRGEGMSRAGGMLRLLGLACLLASAVWTGYYLWQDLRAGRASESVLARMDERAASEDGRGGASVLIVDGRAYVGRVRLPSLGLDLPVLAAFDLQDLELAPAVFSGDFHEGGLVIAGHSYRSQFGPLWDVVPGECVELVDVRGEVYRYQVVEVERLQPTEVEAMVGSGYDLSLFTCTPGGSARLAVRCMRLLA